MFGQSLLSGAFGTALVPGDNFIPHRYIGTAANQMIGGKYEGSAAFNGSDNYWTTGAGLGENGDRTRALWLYINTMPAASSGDAIYYLGDGSSNGYYENLAVRETAGATTYKFRYNERYDSAAGGSNEEIYSITTLTTGVWYHVAIVFDGSSRKLYVNGSLDNSTTFTNTVNNTSYPLYLATFRNVCCYLDCTLDQVRLYNTALNATQIGYLYNASNTESTTLDFPSGTGCKAAYTFNNNGNTILSQDDLDTVDFPSGAGCVGLYRLQNSGVDTAGNNNGTLVNSPGLADPIGPFGDCMDFTPASSQYINLGTGVYNGYTAMTVSAWVWYDAASNYPYTFWAGDGGTDGAGIGLALNHSTWLMYSWNGGTTQTTNTVFNAYQWYHVAVTYGGTTCKWYINGDLDSTHTVTQMNLDTSSNPTSIGYYSDAGNPGYYFDGKMAQMRIYNTALTAAQIETLAKGEPKYNGTVWPGGVGVKFNRSLNLKPDLTWIKDRTTAYSHVLIDSLRGPDSEINSNDTTAAYTETSGLTAFTSNGFNLGTLEYSYNKNNDNYISWNWKAGADTYAGLFNGSTSKFKITSPLGIEASSENDNFSISMWVTWDSVDASSGALHGTIVGDITGSNYGSFHIYVYGLGTGNGLSLGFERYFNGTAHYNNAYNTVGTISSLVAQKWYNITHTYVGSSKEVKLYLDGTLVTTYTLNTTSSGRTTNIYNVIGDYDNRGGYGHDGQIDQIRMFNTTLTSTQINSLISEGLSDNNTLDFPTGAGCTAAYTFDNTANSVVNEAGLATCDFPTGTGCQALYQFGDDVTDACGNYNGTANDINYVSGVFNRAAVFNGSSSYIDTNYTLPAVATISFSLWFKTTTTGSQMFLFGDFSSGGANASGRLSLSIESSNNFGIRTGDGSSYFTDNTTASASSYQDGNWHHAVLTANGTALKLYVDGVLIANVTSSVAVGTAGAQSTTLGRLGDYNTSHFNGQLDQVRIFTSTLTQSQVTELTRGYYPGTPTNVTYVKPGYTGKNTDGTIESQVSANQDAGFSIVKYSPNDTVGMTVGHGLKKSPELVITKRLDGSQDWGVYTNVSTGNTTTNWLSLNDTDAYGAGSFMTLNPTTLELPQTGAFWSNASSNQIAYCWHSVPKYSQIGTYTGNGSTTGPTVSTGFKPGWLMLKNTANGVTSWGIVDSKRSPVNPRNLYLFADWAGAESSTGDVDFNDTGFQIKSSSNFLNQSGNEILYMAFAE